MKIVFWNINGLVNSRKTSLTNGVDEARMGFLTAERGAGGVAVVRKKGMVGAICIDFQVLISCEV